MTSPKISLSVLANMKLAGALVFDSNVTDFPLDAQVGTMLIKDQALYAYLRIGGITTWYPLVRVPENYIHTQVVPQMNWTVQHDLGTDDIWVFLQDQNGQFATASDIVKTDLNTITISFGEPFSGKALVVGTASNLDQAIDDKLSSMVAQADIGVSVAPLGADGKVPDEFLHPIPVPEVPVTSVAGKEGDVVLDKADVGLGNVDNTSDANKPVSTAQQTALNLKLDANKVGAVSGAASLDATGQVPLSQLGNVPTAPVQSVNGKTGAVTVTSADVGALPLTGGRVSGDIVMAASIIPETDIAYDLGSPTKAWRDVYIGPHSIYMNGKKILEDVSDTITFSTDVDQNLRIETTGAGALELKSDSQVQMKATLSILAGKKIVSSDGNAIQFGNSISLGGMARVSNVLDPLVAQDVATKAYVDAKAADTSYVVTTGDQTIAGNKTFSGDTVFNGNVTIKGTATTTIGETVLINDNMIELNSNVTTGAPTEDGGFQVRRGDAGIVRFIWDEANDRFTMKDGAVTPNYLSLYTTATITAGTFVGALTGNASSATKLATARNINGVSFDGSADISFSTSNVAEGTNLYYTTARGRAAISASGGGLTYDNTTGVISSNATSENTVNATVARDASGNFSAGTITAALAGNATTATRLATARTINGVSFNGTANISFGTDAVAEGATNLYFTTARAAAAAPVQSVAGRTGAVVLAKADVGLGNVDNTSDANKPVSTATQTALNAKLDATAKAVDSDKLDGLDSSQFVRSDSTVSTDQFGLASISKSLTLGTAWQDTGIAGSNLATGSYMLQLYVNDSAVGGGHAATYYTGVMSWSSVNGTESSSDEIVLHRAGTASGSGAISLRVLRTASGAPKLQIAGNTVNTGASSYDFKFRRMI